MLSPQSRWLYAAAALVGSLATVSVARHAGQSNPRRASATQHGADAVPADLAVAGRVDGDSAFGQALSRRLNTMSDQQLDNLETLLPRRSPPGPGVDSQPADGDDMMMADMPPVADDAARATVQPEEFSPEAERERYRSK